MYVFFGNLNVPEIENRLGIELAPEERDFLNSTRQQNAENIKPGKWHCFDLPFVLACGCREMADKLNAMLIKYEKQMKCQIHINVEEGGHQ